MRADNGPVTRQTGCFLSLGSNLGTRQRNLVDALLLLNQEGIRIEDCSAMYETEAVGVRTQPDFLNLVCRAETVLDPRQLLSECQRIENKLGRIRYQKWGPRLIDIDILYYGDQVIESENLTIPHPRLSRRRFVLVPLAQIASDFVDPGKKKRVRQLLRECSDKSRVVYYAAPPLRKK